MSDYKKSNCFELWDSLYWYLIYKHKNIFNKIYATAIQVKLVLKMESNKLKNYISIAKKLLI
jgi:hypothetical protein